jgi:gamma-glutamyltranspeptidase
MAASMYGIRNPFGVCYDLTMHSPSQPDEALSIPRIHHQLQPNVLAMEVSDPTKGFVGFTQSQQAAMSARGHAVELVTPIWSNGCAISRSRDGGYEASGEPRRFEAGGAIG